MIQKHTTFPVGVIVNDYKKIFDQVVDSDEPVIISNHGKPVVAVISIKKLERLEGEQGAKTLLALSQEARMLLKGKDLPTDLSERHDYYLWEKQS